MNYKKITVILSLVPMTLSAGGFDSMQKFFNDAGYAANITGAKAVMHQEGGYVSAGSGFIRTPVRTLQLIHVQAPSYKMGCGGIDLFTGGVSFISSEQLTKFGQAIMQNAVPFAIDLALQTWAPGLKSALDKLKEWAQKINDFNMSSCEFAQTAVAGIMAEFTPKSRNEFICKTYANQTNDMSWLEARAGCTDAAKNESHNANAKKKPELADIIKQNRNLVWYFLMKNALLKENLVLSQYLMGMTGTLVNTSKSGDIKLRAYEPLVTDEKSAGIEVMLKGQPTSGEPQQIKIYQCDTTDQEGCLSPVDKEMVFDSSYALIPKVEEELKEIAAKVESDEGLTPAQQNMINAIDFPLLRLLENHITAGWIPEYHVYADILARIILSAYLNNLINEAKTALSQNDIGGDEDVKKLIKNLNHVQQNIVNKMHTKSYEKLQNQSTLLMRSLELEKIVVGEMSAETQANYYFGHTN